MPVADGAMRAYLQRHPFSDGPDREMNARCQAAVVENLRLRPDPAELPIRTGADAVVRLRPEQTRMEPAALARLHALLELEHMPAAEREFQINDYGWEVNLVPAGIRDVLAIGCASGEELLFLRAVLPGATLTALDYSDAMTAERKQNLGVDFTQGDMNVLLEELKAKGRQFDLVFSNHTLEHVYTPDEILALLGSLLRPDGHLMSTLPMDGMPGRPFLEETKRVAQGKTIHPLDLVFTDAGHPWKTNFTDLQATFLRAGFARVELFQRAEHLSRYQPGTEAEFIAKRSKGERLHALFFGPVRAIGKAVLGHGALGMFAARWLHAVERRVWFGSNTLKNRFSQEVCVVAHKASS
jgi:SAM-dependent methyltransferase